MDSTELSVQIVRLTRQEAQTRHIRMELSRCRESLRTAWSGQDGTEVRRAVGVMIQRCRRLEDQIRELRRDMERAAEELDAIKAAQVV